MKHLLLSLFLLLAISSFTYAQDFSALQSLEFKSKEDYKTYERQVLECATYLLSVPVESNDPNKMIALQTLVKWMTGTPDYTFEIDESISKLLNKNEVIMGPYFASMTKFVLENKDKPADKNEIKLNAFVLLLDYCENADHKVKKTKELKKAIAAKKEGKLKEYLKI